MAQALTLNTNQDRSVKKKLQEMFPGKIVSPSKLRVAVLTESGRGTYSFNIRKDVGNYLPTDRKLDVNDSFAAVKIGIKLLCEDPAVPGSGLLQSYPNNSVFAAEAGNVVPLHLNAFYNASLRYKKDDRVEVESWPTELGLLVRTAQQSAAGNFSESFGEDGVITLPTYLGFDGSAKNDINLDVPAFTSQKIQYVTATTRIYVVFVAFGFLITGVSRMNS